MDYEAPHEHNPDDATVTRWSMKMHCRCGHEIVVGTRARSIRTTCRVCGTVWELSPTVCDATSYTKEKTESAEEAS